MISRDDLLEFGLALLEEHTELNPYMPTEQEIKDVWRDFYSDAEDDELTHLMVHDAREQLKERYSEDMVWWLCEWCEYWAESIDLKMGKPSIRDCALFFTIRGPLGIVKTKATSFYACLCYLKKLEREKRRRDENRPRHTART